MCSQIKHTKDGDNEYKIIYSLSGVAKRITIQFLIRYNNNKKSYFKICLSRNAETPRSRINYE